MLFLLTCPALAQAPHPFSALPSDHHLKEPVKRPPLPLHGSYTDPVFGTKITRLTESTQINNKVSRVRHYYSKANPLNADETKAVFFTSDGGKWLYDTKTWKPIKSLQVISSDPEIQWHPTNPDLFYCMDFAGNSSNVRGMYVYDIRTDKKTLLRDFNEYDTARGKLEGNLDRAGRYYALVGKKGSLLEAFVYDIQNNKVSKKISVSGKVVGDWVSVTPSGKYVVMMGGDRSRVYDIEMNHLRDLPKGSFGHADLCTTTDGRDVMVFDGADLQLDANRNINMVDLANGQVTVLTRIGWKSTPHVSCRNTDLPGWALVSTQGGDKKYPNHDFEIFWVKLDGSNEVRRLAHHYSSRAKGGYFAEQHAVTNRNGTKVIFSSNWDGDAPVSDYLVELPTTPGIGPVSPKRP
jgi:hypothetical protein